jgi:hypothetical protein
MGVGLFSTFSRLLAFYRAAEVATYATQMYFFVFGAGGASVYSYFAFCSTQHHVLPEPHDLRIVMF